MEDVAVGEADEVAAGEEAAVGVEVEEVEVGVAGVAVVISARQDAILMIFAGASYVIHLLFTAYPLEMTGKGHSGGARIKAG